MDTRPRHRTPLLAALTHDPLGPVTDYSATVTHWLRNRTANYKGGYTGEAERPSASYIVDVGLSLKRLGDASANMPPDDPPGWAANLCC